MEKLIAGVEAGGTKFLLGLRRGEQMLASRRVDTREPEATMVEVEDFYSSLIEQHGPVDGCGLATFGPVELTPDHPRFGHILDAPKPGWSGYPIAARLRQIVKAPVAVATDVNAAAHAEGLRGSCRGLDRFCYVTVGTGIGVGFVEGGAPSTAIPHAEAGHMRVGRAPGDDFSGVCPAHGDCAEGLACGQAIRQRWGIEGSQIAHDHVAWDHESHYIAAVCANLTYVFRPQRIVLGGGVFSMPFLLDRVRSAFTAAIGGYAPGLHAAVPETYLVAPELVEPSPGLEGAFLLANALPKERA